jgi:hypothetical protein
MMQDILKKTRVIGRVAARFAILAISLGMAMSDDAIADGPALAEADTQTIVNLIDNWGKAVAVCRSGLPAGRGTIEACTTVHKVLIQLDDIGWCYGRESDPGGPFFQRWHRCDIDSFHPKRP